MNAIPMPAEPGLAAVRSSGGVYRSLEHWRGLAALWVMIFHSVGTPGNRVHPLTGLLSIVAGPGWLGVHLFFVISGYCIAANVESLRAKGRGPMVFLRDRLFRILPTYWAAFAVTLLLAVVAGWFNHTTAADHFPAGVRGWLGDIFCIQAYLGTKCYVIVYWTLAVELGFYFVVTVLFAAAGFSARLATGMALALALAVIWVPPQPANFVLVCWPEFVCGWLVFHAVRADHRQEHFRRNLCLGSIGGLGFMGSVAAHYMEPIVHSPKQLLFGATFALVLYALYPLDDAIQRARSLRWLSFCGLFSFSLYLIHAPFGVRVFGLGLRFFPEQSVGYALLVVASGLVSLSASYVFYRVFEARFEVWRRQYKARAIPAV